MIRKRIPVEVASVVADLPPGEKLKAWATGPALVSGAPTIVVATTRALYAPGILDRLEWQDIVRASWDAPMLEIVISRDGSSRPVRIQLDPAGSVPQILNERVSASIVMQRHIELVGKAGASLVARRVPGSDEVRWDTIFDAGVDSHDPKLREEAERKLQWLRESVGI